MKSCTGPCIWPAGLMFDTFDPKGIFGVLSMDYHSQQTVQYVWGTVFPLFRVHVRTDSSGEEKLKGRWKQRNLTYNSSSAVWVFALGGGYLPSGCSVLVQLAIWCSL